MNCPYCHALNPDQAKFCINCGGRLVPSASTESGKPQATDFKLDQYLPQELVIKLESARAQNSMVGERRVITTLFCDVKGSTAAAGNAHHTPGSYSSIFWSWTEWGNAVGLPIEK